MWKRVCSVAGAVLLGQLSAIPGIAADLEGSAWRPIQIEDVDIPETTEIFVRFGFEGRIEGYGGCNRFFGSYTVDDDAIEIGPLGATQMACPDPAMTRERRFFDALDKATAFARDRTDMSMRVADGAVVLRLVQTDGD